MTPIEVVDNNNYALTWKRFRSYLNLNSMRSAFADQSETFLRKGLCVTGCSILDTRYKTFLNPASWWKSVLSISYQLEVTDPSSGVGATQLLFAQIYLGGRSHEAYRKVQPVSHCVQGAVHLPALDMIVWRFPDDPSLAHLPDATEPQRVIPHLPVQHLPIGVNNATDLFSVNRTIIRYKPNKCCATQFGLQGEPNRSLPSFSLFGKTFRTRRKAQDVATRINTLWDVHKRSPERITLAEPLGYAPPINTIWQRWVEGSPLATMLNADNYERYLDATARGLATVHDVTLSASPVFALHDHLAETRKKCAKLSQAFPLHTDTLEALAQRLERLAAGLPESRPQLIYGDFHVDQLLVSAKQVVFLDFDSFATGDVEQDLAEFIVDLQFRGFGTELSEEMCAYFVDTYQSHANSLVSLQRLNWHILVQLVYRAYHLYVRLVPNLDAEVANVLATIRRFELEAHFY